MPDNSSMTGRDRKFISLEQEHELRHWTKSLGCSEDDLRAAVKAVGNSADAVRKYLTSHASRRRPSAAASQG